MSRIRYIKSEEFFAEEYSEGIIVAYDLGLIEDEGFRIYR